MRAAVSWASEVPEESEAAGSLAMAVAKAAVPAGQGRGIQT